MVYTMKYTKGDFPFKTSPLTDKGHGGKKGHNHDDALDEQEKPFSVEGAVKPHIPMETYEPSDEEVEVKEDVTGVTTDIKTPPVMKSGSKNKAIYKSKDGKTKVIKGNWQPSQF